MEPETSETLLYSFDNPLVTECGSVRITDQKITLQFPEHPSTHVKESIKIGQNINVFVENMLHFSLQWVPIHTWSDFYRMRDMYEKCLQSFSYLTAGDSSFTPHTFSWNPVKWSTGITTNFTKAQSFSIQCFENSYETCVQILLLNGDNKEKETPLHFQLCIGKNIVFCTKRDLNGINQAEHVHFIVKFILYKLINY
jgi:hypothetical protein